MLYHLQRRFATIGWYWDSANLKRWHKLLNSINWVLYQEVILITQWNGTLKSEHQFHSLLLFVMSLHPKVVWGQGALSANKACRHWMPRATHGHTVFSGNRFFTFDANEIVSTFNSEKEEYMHMSLLAYFIKSKKSLCKLKVNTCWFATLIYCRYQRC